MAIVDLVMPKMGESITEATILKWLKKPGDKVQQDETVLEIATDKVDSEIPSTAEGVIEQILFDVNAVVSIGTLIATIRTGVPETNESEQPAIPVIEPPLIDSTHAEKANTFVTQSSESPANRRPDSLMNKFYSPLVLNIAAREGISVSDLETIPGTGNDARVTKKDILQFIEQKNKEAESIQYVEDPPLSVPYVNQALKEELVFSATVSSNETDQPPVQNIGNTEIVEMDRMRKLIADHMVRSKQTSAHVTSFSEADVTNMVMWREKVKHEFEKRESTKITFTPLFIEAVIKCIKRFPLINSSVDGHKIIIKKEINIGMATALPNGSLIVPVIRNADQFNLVGLTKQVNSLAGNARSNKLKPEDTQGGTFTLTNVGSFGSLMGTPIINQPQVAILAVGAIKKRPVVIETSSGDSIAIRHMMYLSMSYDHRIIDGSMGASFLTAVANELEKFDGERQY